MNGAGIEHGTVFAVAQHVEYEGPGLIGEVLEKAGFQVRIVRLDLGEELPPPLSLAGAVVMGGPMGVYDTADFRWLEPERLWLAELVRSSKPVLGVCLGAQQLAVALGADVTTSGRPEIGVGDVSLTEDGRMDPLLGPEGSSVSVVHWHSDTFAIPPGAVHLAQSDQYPNQAFRYGACAYGLQFHVEVDKELVASWAPKMPPGVSLDEGRRIEVENAGRRILGRFAQLALRVGFTSGGS